MASGSLNLCIFGAGPGTGNLGVWALGMALLSGIARRVGDPGITLFDNGSGIRSGSARIGGRELHYHLCGAVPSRRIYRSDSLWRIRASGRLGGLGNPAIDVIRHADAVLDVTSGDSFTDLYSERRFRLVTAEKMIALEQGRPLILPPQTIGPFANPRLRRIAREIIRQAAMVWARDRASFSAMREMLGSAFDPARHRCGVDLAFGLEARQPSRPLPQRIADRLDTPRRRPLVGFNVSGLILGDTAAARQQFRLHADYRRAVVSVLERILESTEAEILLVPHVFSRPGTYEHDPDACAIIAGALGEASRRRVTVLPEGLDPSETKWVIAHTDWFCGTRMHAAIAALSSGVPTAAIAYSGKTLGVFETCGQGRHVADLRHLDTAGVTDCLWNAWESRDQARASLLNELPAVLAQAESQLDEIVECVMASKRDQTPLPRAA